jgi:hypothetical protein
MRDKIYTAYSRDYINYIKKGFQNKNFVIQKLFTKNSNFILMLFAFLKIQLHAVSANPGDTISPTSPSLS